MRLPWQVKRGRRRDNPYAPKRWPKKVYFLDGPMQGRQVDKVSPGLFVSVPVNTNEGIGRWVYEWDQENFYPNALVAYVKFNRLEMR